MELQHIVLTFLVLIRSAPSVNFSAFHMVDAEWKKNLRGRESESEKQKQCQHEITSGNGMEYKKGW